MKSLSKFAVLFFLFFSIRLLGQLPNVTSESPTPSTGVAVTADRISIMGKVITEDGSAPAEKGDVILRCGTAERARVSIDSRGDFTINVNAERGDAPKLRTLDPAVNPAMNDSVQDLGNCDIQAQVSGYASESVHLIGSHDRLVQVGSIILHPTKAAVGGQNFTVSVASLEAPEKAKKAFAKGQDQAKKGRWAAACDSFKRAIQEYPRYAVAWLELGRAQAQQNSFVAAQQSFHEAVSKDSHLTDAYVELARVAVAQKEWKELVDATEHLVEAYPSAPQFWFFNGVAHFNLGDKAQAENSAERGLRIDTKHNIPQLEYLYGLTLAARGDYKNSAEHIANYLHLSPQAADAPNAQAKLAEIQTLANPPQKSDPSQQSNPPQKSQEADFSLH